MLFSSKQHHLPLKVKIGLLHLKLMYLKGLPDPFIKYPAFIKYIKYDALNLKVKCLHMLLKVTKELEYFFHKEKDLYLIVYQRLESHFYILYL